MLGPRVTCPISPVTGDTAISTAPMSSEEAADGSVPAQPGVIAHVAHVASTKGSNTDVTEKGQGE